jgi:clan AA aspartic protease (TIGR02281 family)
MPAWIAWRQPARFRRSGNRSCTRQIDAVQADHCDKARWRIGSKDGKYNVADIEPADNQFDRRTFLSVTINGKKVRAVLDSGAFATVLSRDAAERAGIDLNAPDVKAGSISIGIGAKSVKTWTVNIDSFSVGTETIQHSQMQVIDGRIGDKTDMLLGVDFLLAHHMFIANSKKKAYFTYNGGRVFTLAKAPNDNDKSRCRHCYGRQRRSAQDCA